MSGALNAAVDFFNIDRDLVAAATSSRAYTTSKETSLAVVARLSDQEKTNLLTRLVDGDMHVAAELRQRAWAEENCKIQSRTAGELRLQAKSLREQRVLLHAERKREEAKRRAIEVEQADRARRDVLRLRGEQVWDDVEAEIGCRNALSYDRAIALLRDIQCITSEDGQSKEFARRLEIIRRNHARKVQFINRLEKFLISCAELQIQKA